MHITLFWLWIVDTAFQIKRSSCLSNTSGRNVKSLELINDWDCSLKHLDCILISWCIVEKLVRGRYAVAGAADSWEHFILGSIHNQPQIWTNIFLDKYQKISAHQNSRKRSSPLKLKLNGCQESSDNFYIGTNNIQHLERELLSSVFHSLFLQDWLKCQVGNNHIFSA